MVLKQFFLANPFTKIFFKRYTRVPLSVINNRVKRYFENIPLLFICVFNLEKRKWCLIELIFFTKCDSRAEKSLVH